MQYHLNISESLKEVIKIAQAFVKENKNEKIAPSHMLRALMHKDAGLQPFLKSLGKDVTYIAEWSEVRIDEHAKVVNVPESPVVDEKLAVVFEEADNIRLKLNLDLTDPICLLVAIIKPNYGYSHDQLKSLPLREREILDHYLGTAKIESSLQGVADQKENKTSVLRSGALLQYCIDKTDRVKQGKSDPVVGRDKEIAMMIEILGRRSKPNVLLVGEPGVGKSALVDGFVQKIELGQVPSLLLNARVFELELGALLAGASYKGEVEERIKNILNEIKGFEKAILFIDEIHTLLDSKGSVGSGVANLLKPELARGELTIIAATTQEEFRKIIEPDSAFTRRLENITVHEPDSITTVKMLQSLLHKYETHHGIKVVRDVLPETVRLAKRYIKDKRLPDAAIDLLDRSLAALKMMNETSSIELSAVKAELQKVLHEETLTEVDRLAEYKWLHIVLKNKLSPILIEQWEEKVQESEIKTASDYYHFLESMIGELFVAKDFPRLELRKQDIASMVAYKTGIPIGKIQTQELDRLLNIESHLKRRVVGQNHAIKTLADTIIESRSGISKQGQPIGSFFFLGPTGTGKTELTKALAEFLFNNEKAMIRFDMSEFKEEHSAALLYGAPPGYVGYEEGGLLVNKIRQQPYSVVLFDEIEKAHHSLFDTFLQIMDEGVLHDKLGKEGDFSNALIIFTSNIGSEWVAQQFQKGQLPNSRELLEIMAGHFRPEFLARLSEIVPFAPISEESLIRIFEIQMHSLVDSLHRQNIRIEVSYEGKKMLAYSDFVPRYGARQISTTIRNKLRRPIARLLVTGELKYGDLLLIQADDSELLWKINRNGDTIEIGTKEYKMNEI